MQIFIIHNKTFVLNDIDINSTIFNIKKLISDKCKIPIDYQILQFNGKLLNNDKKIQDYNIVNNASIFLNVILKGGEVKGFPNIGNLFFLLGISTLFLFAIFYLFYLLMYDNLYKRIVKNCLPEKEAYNSLILPSQNKYNAMFKKSIKFGGQNYPNILIELIFIISTLFYASIIVITITTFIYTAFCKKGFMDGILALISDWPVSISLTSIPIILIIFLILDDLVLKKYIDPIISIYIAIIIFTFTGLGILLSIKYIPKITDNPALSIWTYIYPIGVVITGIIYYMTSNFALWTKFLILGGSIIIFIIIPYIMAYIYNVYNLCK